MALRFLDGFDFYTGNTDLALHWDAGSTMTNMVTGRYTGSLAMNTSNAAATKTLASKGTWVIGFNLQASNFTAAARNFLQVNDTGTTQMGLQFNSSGNILVRRNTTTLQTTTFALVAGLWYHFEFKVVIDPTAGSYELRIDGTDVASATGINTSSTGTSTANQIVATYNSNSMNNTYDDFYVLDGDGSSLNTFLGERRVQTKLPSGAGSSTQWTPSTGSNYQNVDESTSNSDTDYNSSSTVGHTDLYTISDFTFTGAIDAVQVRARCRKDDAGTRTVALVAKPTSTTYDGTGQDVNSSYGFVTEVYTSNPDSPGTAWTLSTQNAAEFGVKVIA